MRVSSYPCSYIRDEDGSLVRAGVNCKQACIGCGWNPVEIKRRINEGFTKETVKLPSGETYEIKRIHFIRRNNPDVVR